MGSEGGLLTLSRLQARELAGKRWAYNGAACTFADYDPALPGEPPWISGAEGIAYPLLGPDGRARAYAKLLHELRATPKRFNRTKWLIEQRLDTWTPELSAAPCRWLDTTVVGRPVGVSFDFMCSVANAVPGKTWLEVKLDVANGAVSVDGPVRERCIEDLIRGLVFLERSGLVHGDLSPNNVIIDLQAGPGEPALYLIDFDGFTAAAAGELSRLSVGEGGTIGTEGYCPPELTQKSGQNGFSAAPFSDRYGRDVLLVELLCFDDACDEEDPASQWDPEKVQRRLAESGFDKRLPHLFRPDLFRLSENRRPRSHDLARALRIPIPPRIKSRPTGHGRVGWETSIHRSSLLSRDGLLAKVVFALWALCVVHWGLMSFRAAGWLASPSSEAGFGAYLLALGARVFVGLGVSALGILGLSLWAFAEDRPQQIQFRGWWLRIPARWNKTKPYSDHQRAVAKQLLGILAALASATWLRACF